MWSRSQVRPPAGADQADRVQAAECQSPGGEPEPGAVEHQDHRQARQIVSRGDDPPMSTRPAEPVRVRGEPIEQRRGPTGAAGKARTQQVSSKPRISSRPRADAEIGRPPGAISPRAEQVVGHQEHEPGDRQRQDHPPDLPGHLLRDEQDLFRPPAACGTPSGPPRSAKNSAAASPSKSTQAGQATSRGQGAAFAATATRATYSGPGRRRGQPDQKSVAVLAWRRLRSFQSSQRSAFSGQQFRKAHDGLRGGPFL